MEHTQHRAQTGRWYDGIQMHAAGGLHEYVEAALARLLPRGARLLDVGAGSGALAARLAAAGYDVVAADLETDDYRASAPLVQWDAAAAELPDTLAHESFDGVCAVEVLEHVENPLQALRNFRALLKPGGLLLATTPHIGHPRSRLKYLLTGAPSYFGSREYYADGHRTLLPDWLLARHLETVGYANVQISYAGRMGLAGRPRLLWTITSPFVRYLQSQPRVDDGCITVAVARKP